MKPQREGGYHSWGRHGAEVCPLFPSRLNKKEGKTVKLEMLENGDFKCPECRLTLKNPPQLAWIALVSQVAEEFRREKLLQPQEKEANDRGEVTHGNIA